VSTEPKIARRRANAIAWGYAAGQFLAPVPWKLLMVLARRVNAKRDDFEVWPDQSVIAEDANLSLSTVKRHLKTLEAEGYFTRRQREAPGRGFTGWVYILNVRSEFKMPTGQTVAENFYAAEGIEPTGQIDPHRQVTVDPHRQVTVDLSNTELGNRELGNREPPLVPKAESTEVLDLFGGESEVAVPELADRVLEEWQRLCEEVGTVSKIRVLDKARREAIVKQARRVASDCPDPWEAWKRVFATIRNNTFLRGEEPPTKNYPKSFRLDIDFVLRPSQFLRIFEGTGFYEANRTHETHDPVTGRHFESAEQASRKAFARVRNARAQRGGGDGYRGGEEADGPGGMPTGPLSSAFDQY
jgi:hypothetical protein